MCAESSAACECGHVHDEHGCAELGRGCTCTWREAHPPETRSAAQGRLQASLDEVSLGGNHPIQVIVPRADVREVLAENERMREALKRIASGRVEQRGSLRPSFADAAKVARAFLEGGDDAA